MKTLLSRYVYSRSTHERILYKSPQFTGVLTWVSGPYPFSFAVSLERGREYLQACDGIDLAAAIGCPSRSIAHSPALARSDFEQWIST